MTQSPSQRKAWKAFQKKVATDHAHYEIEGKGYSSSAQVFHVAQTVHGYTGTRSAISRRLGRGKNTWLELTKSPSNSGRNLNLHKQKQIDECALLIAEIDKRKKEQGR